MIRWSFRVCLFVLVWTIASKSFAEQSFDPDEKLQAVAEAYAKDTIEFVSSRFGIKLDWTDKSIESLEIVLHHMHETFIKEDPQPTYEQVMSFAKGYGSYLGEVYRRNHGGEWGVISAGEHRFPGMRTKSGTNFWPWGKVANRIQNGSEDNIAHYYKVLLEQ